MQPNPLQVIKMKREINDEVLGRILINRGVTPETAKSIMTAPEELLEDPAGIYMIEQTAKEIAACLTDEKATIYIFADYDVDGISSGFVIGQFLSSYGLADVKVFWPDRTEGYGLSMSFCQDLAQKRTGRTMVITVDNGVTKKAETDYLLANGIEVVITDHHMPQDGLTPNCTVCDPHTSETSAGHHLAGVGVAWKVCQVLEDIMTRQYSYDSNREYLWSLLYAVALGTIADVMPLTPENIAIVRIGLKQLNSRKGPKNFAYLREMIGKQRWSPTDVAWDIAPRLNACGRMGSIGTAAEFMLSEEKENAELNTIYLNVEELNEQRKKLTKSADKEAGKRDYSECEVCLFDGSAFPAGILGVIAGKIADKHKKPAFVYSIENGIASGSARSNTVELIPLLQAEQERGTLSGYGGHNFACGFSFEEDKASDFLSEMNEMIKALGVETVSEEEELLIDAVIQLKDVGTPLYETVNCLPYNGTNFRKPYFLLKDLKVETVRESKNNPDNIQLTLQDETKSFRTWAWRMGNRYKEIGRPKKIDAVAEIKIDFTNARWITMEIVDFRPAE